MTIIKEIRAPIRNNNDEVEEVLRLSKKGSRKEIEMKIKELEKEMRQAAKVFEFERAAELRDIILEMKASLWCEFSNWHIIYFYLLLLSNLKGESVMSNWYDWVFLVVGVLIIVLCLLQGGKSEGASGAITGGGLNVFVKTKERGAEKVVSILTLIAAGIFFIFAIIINVLSA